MHVCIATYLHYTANLTNTGTILCNYNPFQGTGTKFTFVVGKNNIPIIPFSIAPTSRKSLGQ